MTEIKTADMGDAGNGQHQRPRLLREVGRPETCPDCGGAMVDAMPERTDCENPKMTVGSRKCEACGAERIYFRYFRSL